MVTVGLSCDGVYVSIIDVLTPVVLEFHINGCKIDVRPHGETIQYAHQEVRYHLDTQSYRQF
jgi:hypothetical protein